MLSCAVRHTLDDFELDVSFDLGNEVLSILGPSGAGKSMTMQFLAGLRRPQHGRILHRNELWFDSATRRNLRPQKRKVGMVFQNYALFPHLAVARNIAFGLAGLAADRQAELVASLMEELYLGGLGNRYPDELSGGQQQRVALARALAPSPGLLLLDEPFSAVDITVRTRLLRLVSEVQRRRGCPTIFITHNLEEAFLLSDRLLVIERGRVLQLGKTAEVFAKPNSHAAARILGTRNVWNAVVTDRAGEGSGGLLRLQSEGGLCIAAWGSYRPGEAVSICIRPTRIDIVSTEGGVRSKSGTITELVPAVVTGVESRGDSYTVRARLRDVAESQTTDRVEIELSAAAFERRAVRVGESVRLAIPRDAIHLFPNS